MAPDMTLLEKIKWEIWTSKIRYDYDFWTDEKHNYYNIL